MPDATLARLIRPTSSVLCRSDKAFTPHPAITALPDAITLRR
ncbi:mannitol-1-phosphate 5-dehydrogenase [Escherichia coli]|nr:mannitol-1-phosphate 5-dehydrogenase [Escherichia coli]AHM36372.1 mannitol-1-phosphate 5-dehydrogenase [Escherichia coli]AHM40971.1 mannitol-1-phosphate 5-dehydrogenase [Escherichia coli]